METKIILTILTVVGVPSYIAAILLNIGTWKADLLFGLMFAMGFVRFIRYCIKTYQDWRKENIVIRKLRSGKE